MLTLRAPAKINLCLRVLGRRPDGYHDLESVFQMVGLFDDITIQPRREGIVLTVEGADLPGGPGNLAYEAAAALAHESSGSRGVSIHLVKRIPLGAGLGGGSSDAATVLMGLNRLWGLGWSRARLAELGATLGSDVPFFFFGPTAWVTGRGERVAPAPHLRPSQAGPMLPWAVLVNPGIAVSTKWAFEALGLTNDRGVDRMPRSPGAPSAAPWLIPNDLERVTAATYPVVEDMKTRLLKSGARVARMSGSGPTVFGVFQTRAEAAAACEDLSPSWRRWVVRLLRRAPW
jgi:4-diphosphocytidyl-2-C-methyl-D-erythritol kinase